jgi:hypothetical protein
MSTSLTPAQQEALAKLQSYQQQQGLEKYLASRAQQYGATPKGAASATGWTAGEALENPFAGLKDFGKKSVDVYGTDEELSNVVSQREENKTASDILKEKFGEQLGHKSTFTKAYRKDEKGNPVEVDVDSLTPADFSSGNVILYMGGKTGGKERERMAQAYVPQGDKLIPVGDPQYYKGEHPDAKNVATALKIAGFATLPFGGIGGLLGGAASGLTTTLAGMGLGSLAPVASNALVSGVVGGGLSKAMGGDFSKGFKSGAVSGAVGSGLNQFAGDTFKGLGALETPAKSIATAGITSALTGQKFDLGQAAKNAGTNYLLNQAVNAGGQALGVDPKQQAALIKFANFAMPMIAARRKPGGL